MKIEKNDWHGPFCDAMQLEFMDEEGLEFQREVVLNTHPISLDLLIVKKDKRAKIKNEIGKIFRGYNIFEYKSPGDQLGTDAYYKTLSYAALYKADTGTENEIKAEDITMSLVREEKPVKLMRFLEKEKCKIVKEAPGVYYVSGNVLFKTQIIVTKELPRKSHLWLRSLTRDIMYTETEELISAAHKLEGKDSMRYTDSILYLLYKELQDNEKKKGYKYMFEKTMSLFKDEIDEIVVKAVKEANMEKDEIIAQRESQLAKYGEIIAKLKAENEALKSATM